MKSIAILGGTIVAAFSGLLHSQDAMKTLIERHTAEVAGVNSLKAVFSSIQRDVKGAGAGYFGLNEQDADQLSRILGIDRTLLEREAISPFMQEICASVGDESTDVVNLASVFAQAVLAEEKVVESALSSILNTLSDDGFEKVNSEISRRTLERTYWVVDWVGLAQEEPEYMRQMLGVACSRFNRAGEETTASEAVLPGVVREQFDGPSIQIK
jgi:hypothetical protein